MTKLLDSFFQSITARTARFNTVDPGGLTNATILVVMIFMFVAASPAQTPTGSRQGVLCP